jgi:uncharacterized protein (TIGR03435 family)
LHCETTTRAYAHPPGVIREEAQESTGTFDAHFVFTTESPAQDDSSAPSLFTAIEEQLGLKLESTKGPVEILVIDHVERPSEN